MTGASCSVVYRLFVRLPESENLLLFLSFYFGKSHVQSSISHSPVDGNTWYHLVVRLFFVPSSLYFKKTHSISGVGRMG